MENIKVLYTPINGIGVGGLSTIAFKLGTNMDHNVEVDFFATYELDNYIYKEIANKKNGKIFETILDKNVNKLQKKMAIIRNFSKVLRENKYDIIHIHIDNSYNGFLYGIIARIYSKKSKIYFHSHNAAIVGKLKNVLHSIFKPFLMILGDEFCTCSTEAANWMFPKSVIKNKRIITVENGIDIDKFKFDENIRKKYRKEMNLEEKFVIGHVGRFAEQKNHEFLIDVFERVHQENKNAVLLLVGIGELEEKMKTKVKDLQLEDEVYFLESRNDIKNLLQAMDIFVLPSLFEGLPIVSIESQVSGLITLLSENITKESKIIESTRFISLNKNSKEWAEEILKIDSNYDRKKYENEIIESDFNIKKSALKLEHFYFDLIKNKE